MISVVKWEWITASIARLEIHVMDVKIMTKKAILANLMVDVERI